jgi:hypothetical protein
MERDGEEDLEEDLPAARRARLRATRRERKLGASRMRVSGKGVFLIQRLREERAERARARLGQMRRPKR